MKTSSALGQNRPANPAVLDWVQSIAELTTPDAIFWCDGSEEQDQLMRQSIVDSGAGVWLDPNKRPNSLLVRSDPRDVARVEQRTFICSQSPKDAGPTNNWEEPRTMKTRLEGLFKGCMKGRTLYVIPFCMGPIGSPISQYGIELSGQPLCGMNMRIMTRMGAQVYEQILRCGEFREVPALRRLPLESAARMSPGRATPRIPTSRTSLRIG